MKRNEQKIENTWKTEDIFKDEAAFLACLDTCKELGMSFVHTMEN